MNHRPRFPRLLALLPTLAGVAWGHSAFAAENLDRGVVALRQSDGRVYVGWRLLASDPADIAFHVARAENRDGPWRTLTPEPLKTSCNFVDADAAGPPRWYRVQPVAGQGVQTSDSSAQPTITGA